MKLIKSAESCGYPRSNIYNPTKLFSRLRNNIFMGDIAYVATGLLMAALNIFFFIAGLAGVGVINPIYSLIIACLAWFVTIMIFSSRKDCGKRDVELANLYYNLPRNLKRKYKNLTHAAFNGRISIKDTIYVLNQFSSVNDDEAFLNEQLKEILTMKARNAELQSIIEELNAN